MKQKIKMEKILLSVILIFIILFSMCPKVFATNGNEMSISSKEGIGNTVEIISESTNSIRSESVADVVSYLTGQNITVNSITNHKGASVELTSTALIGTGYVLDTNNGNYSAIVYGDANGDGEADAGDMKIIIDDFLGIKQASPIAKIAVDVYQDGDLDAADLKQVLDSFLGNLSGSILKTTSASNPTPTPDVSVTPTPTPTSTSTIVSVEQVKRNPFNYYGKVVTNYNCSATNTVWRIFYVDTLGKFGPAGAVYLKADPVQEPSGYILPENNQEAVNKMKEINPRWAQIDGRVDTDNEKAVLYMCKNNNWLNYCDGLKTGTVIGGPSVEMFIDSYNQYHSYKNTTGYTPLSVAMSGYNAGYAGTTVIYNKWLGYRITNGEMVYAVDEDVKNMYNEYKLNDYINYLASPGHTEFGSTNEKMVCMFQGDTLGIALYYGIHCSFCPVAELNEGVELEIQQ